MSSVYNNSNPDTEKNKVEQYDPDNVIASDRLPPEIGEVDLYQKREKIYTRAVKGFYQKIRVFTGWPLLIAYFFGPWLMWGDRQAILFDLSQRQFHLFGLTFWPQDFSLLAWALIISAFSLFLVTAIAGRIWCGYTCPQTVWTSMFMWVEQKVEGSRNQRIKLDAQPWSLTKLGKKLLKHGMWIAIALLTGVTFVGYFTPIKELGWQLYSGTIGGWALIWVVFFTWTTYVNAAWLREQVCIYMCPYARFQSVMFDSNTLTVSYDAERGEPRGRRKKTASPEDLGLGDCVNCELCVQVCPTGIDIRDGLQYECIGCALCIDACDSVMEQMGYAPKLISYTSENALAGKSVKFFRGRVIGYGLAILIMTSLFLFKVATREPFEISVLRDRQELAILWEDNIENRYTFKVSNKTQKTDTYSISIKNSSYRIMGNTTFSVKPGETWSTPTRVLHKNEGLPFHSDINFIIESKNTGKKETKQSSFFNVSP